MQLNYVWISKTSAPISPSSAKTKRCKKEFKLPFLLFWQVSHWGQDLPRKKVNKNTFPSATLSNPFCPIMPQHRWGRRLGNFCETYKMQLFALLFRYSHYINQIIILNLTHTLTHINLHTVFFLALSWNIWKSKYRKPLRTSISMCFVTLILPRPPILNSCFSTCDQIPAGDRDT